MSKKPLLTIFLFLLSFSLIIFSTLSLAGDVKSKKSADDENAQVINNMKSGGFDFSRSHAVDFFALFSTKKQADTVASMYQKEKNGSNKFNVIDIIKDENGDYELLVQVVMDVTYENITGFENNMAARAIANKGKFNGWGVFE